MSETIPLRPDFDAVRRDMEAMSRRTGRPVAVTRRRLLGRPDGLQAFAIDTPPRRDPSDLPPPFAL